jgi:hypothetical protein
MFIMIEGDLLNLEGITAVTPEEKRPGCIVQFTNGGTRYYSEHGPECFSQALISGCIVHYVGGKDGEEEHEC